MILLWAVAFCLLALVINVWVDWSWAWDKCKHYWLLTTSIINARRRGAERGGKIVADVHAESIVLSEKQTIRFHFDGFADLPHERGETIVAPSKQCHAGHEWNLELYPRGDTNSNEEDVHVSAYLCCETNTVTANFAFRVSSAGCHKMESRHEFRPGSGGGWPDFIKRDAVLNPAKNYLVNGTLTIEVDIQVYLTKPEKWTFHKTPQPEWLKLLDDFDDCADVTFAVGGVEFPAHRNMLKLRAPGLAELAEEYTNQDVPFDDVDASMFEVFRHFIYSCQLPKDFNLDEESAKTLLVVADKCGCSSMKLFAEAKLVETAITVDTAADLLLLADGKNCALLKEAVVCFFVLNRQKVKQSEGYSKVRESAKLLSELDDAIDTAFMGKESNDVDRMWVASLRRKLDEAGIDDVDGTREMLVKRLQDNGGSP